VALSGPKVIEEAHYSGYEDLKALKDTAIYAYTLENYVQTPVPL
jgi:hypothetical protein